MSEWQSSDEESDFKAISSRSYQRAQDKVTKIGYVDGIADGREKVFQASFDQGYADGLKTALEMARLSGFFETLKDKAPEFEAYKALNLPEVEDKTHFKYLEHQGSPLNEVSEKQTAYVDQLRLKMEQALPATTNLFR
ncbi:hypothetical protein KR018_012663 [Drosophila ironensis]|nr:hypothetical protein KR018_012663 [Drosophila ironensis]